MKFEISIGFSADYEIQYLVCALLLTDVKRPVFTFMAKANMTHHVVLGYSIKNPHSPCGRFMKGVPQRGVNFQIHISSR